jgi:carbon monoxide dehydrogenase subunit G
MELTSSRKLPAAPDVVWKALNDPSVLKDCIPGCEQLEREADNTWKTIIATRIGPVSARFTGKISIVDAQPPTGYTLRFEGQGGPAGFADGEAKVTLAPADAGQTMLSYAAKARIGGKIAQIGSRLVDGAAMKLADDFFARFAERVAPSAVEIAVAAPAATSTVAPGRDPAHVIRIVAIVAIVLLLIVLYLHPFR